MRTSGVNRPPILPGVIVTGKSITVTSTAASSTTVVQEPAEPVTEARITALSPNSTVDVPQPIQLNGISQQGIDQNQLRQIKTTIEAQQRVGTGQTGLYIPYLKVDGSPVIDLDIPFGRLRLDDPQGDKKYHQRIGTELHVYVPHLTRQKLQSPADIREVVLVEGEKKAIALSEHMDCSKIAVGISGFSGWRKTRTKADGNESYAIHPELEDILRLLKLNGLALFFLGDSDTALNPQFASEAETLIQCFAQVNKSITVKFPRMSLVEPKGIDDLIAASENPDAKVSTLLQHSLQFKPDMTRQEIMMELLQTAKQQREAAAVGKPVPPTIIGLNQEKIDERMTWIGSLLLGSPKLFHHFKELAKSFTGLPLKVLEAECKKYSAPEKKPYEIYYGEKAKDFIVKLNSQYSILAINLTRTHLTEFCGYSWEESNRELLKIACNKLDYLVNYPGFKKGFQEYNGKRFLNTSTFELPAGQEGDCSQIQTIISRMLPNCQERQIFEAFLSLSIKNLQAGVLDRHAQGLVLAGPPDCGKSITLKQIILPIFGNLGTSIRDWISGQTKFNSSLPENLIWYLDDDDILEKNEFVGKAKQICVGGPIRIEGKHKDDFMIPTFHRFIVTLNDTPRSLNVLPELTSDSIDKWIMLHCQTAETKLTTSDAGSWQALQKRIQMEIPHYIQYLANLTIPEDLKHTRYGIKSYISETLKPTLQESSPDNSLLEILRLWNHNSCVPKSGTGAFIYRLLLDDEPTEKLLRTIKNLSINRMCKMLEQLADKYPTLITCTYDRKRKVKVFTVHPENQPGQTPTP